jgi:hypothetical protein
VLPLIDLGQLSEAELKEHGTADPEVVARMMGDLFEIYGDSSILFILGAEQDHSSEFKGRRYAYKGFGHRQKSAVQFSARHEG